MKFNISSVKDYLKCEAYAHYAHDLRRVKSSSGSRALTTGIIWHKVMEEYLKSEDIDACDRIAAAECSAISDVKLNADVTRDLSGLMLGLEVWQKPVDWQVHATEIELSGEILGGHTLVGTLDGLVQWNGFWWHVQHKTISETQNLPVYWDYMTRDWHECGYQYLAKVLGYEPYAGTLLITARKMPMVRAQAKRQNIITHNFLTRSDQVVDKAIRDLGEIATRWEAKKAVGSSAFLQNRDQCAGPFRNSPCQYLGVCNGVHSLDDSVRYTDAVSRYDVPAVDAV